MMEKTHRFISKKAFVAALFAWIDSDNHAYARVGSSRFVSRSLATDSCYPNAKKLRLESTTGEPIQMFEFEAMSSGVNVALNKTAHQSSTFKAFNALLALDGSYTSFSHTESNDTEALWEVDLGDSFSLESIFIKNRFCGDVNDVTGCLCRLSSARLSLIGDQDEVVLSQTLGDTCGEHDVHLSFDLCNTVTSAETAAEDSCYPDATTVKIQSTTGEQIGIFELEAISLDDVNVALNQPATQSSTYDGASGALEANNAVDGNTSTFSATASNDPNPTWQVDLGNTTTLKAIDIKNRYCTTDPSDPKECLCRLSGAIVSLSNELGEVVATKTLGNTCGVHNIRLSLSTCASPTSASPTSASPTSAPQANVSPATAEGAVPLITFSDAIVTNDDSFEITFNNPLDQSEIYAAVVSHSRCDDGNSNVQVDSSYAGAVVGSSSVTLSQSINDLISAEQRNSGSVLLEFCLRADVHAPGFPSSLLASKMSLGITVHFEDESSIVLGDSTSGFSIDVVTADFSESSAGYTTERGISVGAILGECATPGDEGPYELGSTLKFCVKSTDSDVVISSLDNVSFSDLDGNPILGITDSAGEPSFVTTLNGLDSKEVDVATMMTTTIFDQGYGGTTIKVQGTVSVTYIDQPPNARRRQLKTEEIQPFTLKISVGESATQAETYYDRSATPAGNIAIGAIIAGVAIVGLVVISATM